MATALDFRSDTVTQPTPAMRAAMAAAEVGDDVFGEDPTVNRLERRVAELLGKQSALFVPSGTMSNAIAVMLHCRPGDEILCEAGCHIVQYEQGGYARLAGAVVRTVEGRHGVLQPEQFADLIRPDNPHLPQSRLVTLENTHNRGGGTVQPFAAVEAICRWARDHGLRTHLDGARLMHAVVATGIEAARWAQHFDTAGICFSKGLGAPVGSALAGRVESIRGARRIRKLLGGGMRQAGVLAAAALYALDHHVIRLADDHANAQRLAEGIRGIGGLVLEPERVETNLVFFHVDPNLGTADEFADRLKQRGVLVSPFTATKIRMVTHLDLSRSDVERALEILAAATRK